MPTRFRAKNSFQFKSFTSLTKAQRKEKVIKVKNQIRFTEKLFGTSLFTSHSDIREGNRPDAFCQNFLFSMLGNHKHDIWIVDMITANEAFWREASKRASDIAEQKLLDVGITRHDFEDGSNLSLKEKIHRWLSEPKPTYDVFDGRTFQEEKERIEAELILNTPPVIHEALVRDEQHPSGIYFELIVDVPKIDASVIEAVAQRLRATNASAYVVEQPVSREKLPATTFHEAMTAADAPGYMLGWPLLPLPGLMRRLRIQS
jgi:hypothetical protein